MLRFTSSQFGSRGLKGTISAIVTKAASDVLELHKTAIQERIKRLSKLWQQWVRLQIGIQHTGGVNKSPWPHMRTGKLRAAVRQPDVLLDGNLNADRLRLNAEATLKIKMSGLYQVRGDGYGNDVGEILNKWRFPGTKLRYWRDRTQRTLFLAMKRVISGGEVDDIGDIEDIYNTYVTDNYKR